MNPFRRFFFFLLLAAGCAPTPASVEMGPLDVNALIDGQVSLLAQRKVELSKETLMGGILSDSTFSPTNEAWRAELDIFRQLAIVNKSTYRSTYRHEGPLNDPNSNLLIVQYTSTASPLKLLRIYYREDLTRIRRIEGFLTSGTILYTTERSLSLEFEEEDDNPVLARYTITGFQKLALRDTVRFHVVSTITW